jgi:hypothetical protein
MAISKEYMVQIMAASWRIHRMLAGLGVPPSFLSMRLLFIQDQIPKRDLVCQAGALHLANAVDVGGVYEVPGVHVLVHAVGEACLVGAGKGGAGLLDAALEAVVLQFLRWVLVSSCKSS